MTYKSVGITDTPNELLPNKLHHRFHTDAFGKPTGGYSKGTGLALTWQAGPVEDGKPNGAFIEDLIRTAIHRLEWYQSGEFACEENAQTIEHLQAALQTQMNRTKDRIKRNVEGTYKR